MNVTFVELTSVERHLLSNLVSEILELENE